MSVFSPQKENEVKTIGRKWELVVQELKNELEELRYARNIEQRTTLLCDENDRLRDRILDLQEVIEKLNSQLANLEKQYEEILRSNELANFELRSFKVNENRKAILFLF